MAEIMFETFNVPALYVAAQGPLSIEASGRTTGCLVEIGGGVTHITPVQEGFAITEAIARYDVAGRDIANYLKNLLRDKGYAFSAQTEADVIRMIKEQLCFVALDPEKEKDLANKVAGIEKSFKLPEDDVITIGMERFLAPEALFNPGVIGKDYEPLADVICNCIKNCDQKIRKSLYANIVLAGGSTMYLGFKERLTKEIKQQLPESVEINITAPPERMYSAWIGGSILASLKTFQTMWVTRLEYKNEGPQAMHRCF